MKVLGLYDWHNCSAALIDDMEIVAAVEQERLSRRKVDFGFPWQAMSSVLEIAGVAPEEIDAIAVCGLYDPTPLVRRRPAKLTFERKISFRWWLQYRLWKVYYELRSLPLVPRVERFANGRILHRQVKKWADYQGAPLHQVDHHMCHARLGFHSSGFDEALIFTIDGSGDGFSTAVFRGRGEHIELIAGAREKASFAKLYANATLGLGFSKLTGEGKIMGLAAHGDPEPYKAEVDKVLSIRDLDSLDIRAHADLLGNGWALQVRKDAERFSREDIAAAVQARFEQLCLQVIEHFVAKFGLGQVVLVGGAAMNVKMNQRVRETKGVNAVFVPPAMTDAGVGAGAALDVCQRLMSDEGLQPKGRPQTHTYLGPSYSDEQIAEVLERRGHDEIAERPEDIDAEIGRLVAEGNIVARFTGGMEHGPRALGNRSILALVTDPTVERRLNERLGRDEFMPFAPSILEEHAAQYLERYVYSPFMVETFDVKSEYCEKFPAVVHVDRTLRPQIVRREVAPGYWRVIDIVGELTGHYLVLNTSFNLHGDPIICAPDEAIDAFEKGAVDYLALGGWLLRANTGQL